MTKKKGFSLVEVVVSMAIISIVIIATQLMFAQTNRSREYHEALKESIIIIENMHEKYIADPTFLTVGENTVYVTLEYEFTHDDTAIYIYEIDYNLTLDNNIYSLELITVKNGKYTFFTDLDLGRVRA